MDLDRTPSDDRGAPWPGPAEPAIASCVGCRQPFWSAAGIERHGTYCASLPADPWRLVQRILGRFLAAEKWPKTWRHGGAFP